MSIELKVKSKHLSVEAKIIRHEEHKLKRQIEWAKTNEQDWAGMANQWFSLNEHRRWDVRNENRSTFLARAYIAGKPYKSVEAKREESKEATFYNKILPRVLALVKKYDNPNIDLKHIQAWVDQQ
jgi:hypothetical protein